MKTLNIKKYKSDIDCILDHLGLERNTNCGLLRAFVNVPIPPNFSLPPLMEEQRELLEKEGYLWNEEELKMHFLSFVFKFSDIQAPKKIKLFYERTLAGIVQDTPLSVVCDAMLATPLGINAPRSPYFFLQEFKKGKKSQDDAEGQMLQQCSSHKPKTKTINPFTAAICKGEIGILPLYITKTIA